MSELTHLEVAGVRNLLDIRMEPEPGINLIYGENGSGKTSLLEAIHLLAAGRSFRSGKTGPLINHDLDAATVFTRLADEKTIGVEKTRQRGNTLKFNAQPQQSWEQVARELPVQVLDAHAFQLLEGGPKIRRRFLDWGVFHMEHDFLDAWRKARRSLANRNLLLKRQSTDKNEIAPWNQQLSQAAEQVDRTRRKYFAAFLPQAEAVYATLNRGDTTPEVTFSYDRGWDSTRPLLEVLQDSLPIDTKYRATQHGPHRADIVVRCGRNRAVDILSRGQQKLLVCALKLAQSHLLSQSLNKKCLYLVDDLPAELDEPNTAAVLSALQSQTPQLFITSVIPNALENALNLKRSPPMFHMEHGQITTP